MIFILLKLRGNHSVGLEAFDEKLFSEGFSFYSVISFFLSFPGSFFVPILSKPLIFTRKQKNKAAMITKIKTPMNM